MRVQFLVLFIFSILVSCNRFKSSMYIDSCEELPNVISKEWRKYKNPKTDFAYYCKIEFINLLDSMFIENSSCNSNYDKSKVAGLFGKPHEILSMKNDEIKFMYGTIPNKKEVLVFKYKFHYRNMFYTYDGSKQNHQGFIEFVFDPSNDQFLLYNRHKRLF